MPGVDLAHAIAAWHSRSQEPDSRHLGLLVVANNRPRPACFPNHSAGVHAVVLLQGVVGVMVLK